MSIHFREIAEQAAADGTISAAEVLTLRRVAWPDGVIGPEEAEAIVAINDLVDDKTPEWSDFFCEALVEYVVNGSHPKGYVDPATADWLIAKFDLDGRVDSPTELEVLVRVVEKAVEAPPALKDYVLAQIEAAVVSGDGPTRTGQALEPGRVTAGECALLRRTIFARAGDGPGCVSRAEAEALVRIKEASAGADNAPEWTTLFVQGVGSYLQGLQHAPAPSRQRAAELEAFMNDRRSSVGGFLGHMAGSLLGGGLAQAVLADRAEASHVPDNSTITADEQAWLDRVVQADGVVDPMEQALLDFLTGAPSA